MSMVIRVHFNGKVFIPEEPVDLPVGESIEAEFRVNSRPENRRRATQAAWEQFIACVVPGLSIPEDAYRRENMYEDPE